MIKSSAKILLILFFTTFSTIIHSHWFDIVPIKELLKRYPFIQYHKVYDPITYDYEKLSILTALPSKATFDELFVLTIPNGMVQSEKGYVLIDNHFIAEMIWADQPQTLRAIQKILPSQLVHAPGRVAVISQSCDDNYCHWLQEVLCRLALLEKQNIEYDWLCTRFSKPFMKETLALWGIDLAKIFSIFDQRTGVKAKTIILPSMILNSSIGFKTHAGVRPNPAPLHYVSEKLISAAQKTSLNNTNFCKKVFISRKDAPLRKILNEDEIFALFQAHGFTRYELSKLSATEQILLFNNAEIVVGEHGAGLVNIMFCKPKTRVIEIFQALIDSSFWYTAHTFDLNYTAIKTLDFTDVHMTDWSNNMNSYMAAWKSQATVPLDNIIEILKTL
jgi:capsular polysaccharide biosynthesis protein